MAEISRPTWIRLWLYGTKKRSAVTRSIWACILFAAVFLAAGFYAPLLYLLATAPPDTDSGMYIVLGMTLMPDLRIIGTAASALLLVVALIYWRAMRWVDRHGSWG